MKRLAKKRASIREYTPQNQLTLECFENPFGDLDRFNRWVILSDKIPWDTIVRLYRKYHPAKATGRRSVSPRVLIGAIIIKHLNDYDDRETIEQIRENIYLQYFLGFTGFSTEAPFHASVFVEIRKKLTPDLLQEISELLLGVGENGLLPDHVRLQTENEGPDEDDKQDDLPAGNITHKGELLMDATVAPQAIAYPTDLNLLNDARMMSEKIIDFLWDCYKRQVWESKESLAFLMRPDTVLAPGIDLAFEKAHYGRIIETFSKLKKPRTYRKNARKEYLETAQNKKPGKKKIRKAIGKQLRYLRRNIGHIGVLLDINDSLALAFPLPWELQRYYWVIQLLYDQQLEMYEGKKHQVNNRLVSIHQPHVRPIVRGKVKSPTEFGAKIHLSMIDGYSFIDSISWDAFHEGSHLPEYVENYKKRYGFYPEKVLVDKLYATRENRKWLNERGIKISAKPLGRPSAKAVENHVSPGERNPIEGLFGRAKTAYGMGRVRAKLAKTSESWIASIILVLNLVKWAGSISYCLLRDSFSNSAGRIYREILTILNKIRKEYAYKEKPPLFMVNQGRFSIGNAV